MEDLSYYRYSIKGWKAREFFPDDEGKGSLFSSYEAETGLRWMWVGPSSFLSSGDGYVGELLDLQQGCEGPFRSSRAYTKWYVVTRTSLTT